MNLKYKIYSINEWKESDNYTINKFFKSKELYIKKIFDTNELYKDLEYERFEHNSSSFSNDVRFAYVFFSDSQYSYKLEIIIDMDKLNLYEKPSDPNGTTNINDLIIEELDYNLYATNEFGDSLESVSTTINEDELIDDFIITLISEIQEQIEK